MNFKPMEGEVQVKCKYNPDDCRHSGFNTYFDCSGINCFYISTISWTKFLINRQHLIEVKYNG